MKMNLVQHLSFGVAVIGTIGVGSISSAQAFNLYTITDLGNLMSGTFDDGYDTAVTDINESGQVIGQSLATDGKRHGFIWQNGTITDLGIIDNDTTYDITHDINEVGQVVGSYRATDGNVRDFVWQNGTITYLENPDFRNRYPYHRINDLGQVVGSYQATDGDGSERGFVWQNGTITDLGRLCCFPLTGYALDINKSGQIVGSYERTDGRKHSFIWQNGIKTDLGTFGGEDNNVAYTANKINDKGQVIGTKVDEISGDRRAFMWQNGVIKDLDTSDLSTGQKTN
jgi:probable HAF family extracellular repeat protein